MKRAKFKLWKSRTNGLWFWNLTATNGEIIAQSESYFSRQGARKGIRAVRRYALIAKVEEV